MQSDLSIKWRTLFHGHLVGEISMDRPVLNILATEDMDKEPSKNTCTCVHSRLHESLSNGLKFERQGNNPQNRAGIIAYRW
ncbi:hypothetical protein LJ707_17735 [Mucilaginibacter sp. UR6-1]|uniref:hypothetical protein n=1 Tax=Mucilaginibacter sp. UR6-1 TaxID=1435643 RepID=UPI001E487304|nr:hypothetical protein [Mucilaginibacter sp. UR6-1]MCC8410788.1 hypothetical protein [Mucilaginibacter sp. UR6-1]